ncbi:MAG TPA: hypothetical protein VGT41_01115 [Candidatus Babeliales bacterium]|nr:hypothetical protein [Candidatus Babeliales bacterium]
MKFGKLEYYLQRYRYSDSSGIEMSILGCFLSSDVGCSFSLSHKDWIPDDHLGYRFSNRTFLEKQDGYIYLSDLHSEEDVPTKLKMCIEQFVQLLDDWNQKVCKLRPQVVIIKQENNQFIIETHHESPMMTFVRFRYDDQRYNYYGGNGLDTDIVGCFLAHDVKENILFYKDWVFNNPDVHVAEKATTLHQKNGNVYLSGPYERASTVKMSIAQFVQLLDDWEQKVCKSKPEEVIIKHEDGQFIIETKNETSIG